MLSSQKALIHVEIDGLVQKLSSNQLDAAATLSRVTALPKAMLDAVKPTQDGIALLSQDVKQNLAGAVATLAAQHAQQLAESSQAVTTNVGNTLSVLRADVTQRLADAVTQLNNQHGQQIAQNGNTLMANIGTALSALQTRVTQDNAESAMALTQRLDKGFNELLDAIQKANSPTPAPAPAPAPCPAPGCASVSTRAAPLLRLLAQVQTLALDATPGQPYKGKDHGAKDKTGENVALEGLFKAAQVEAAALTGAPHDLKDRFLKAFYEFRGADAQQRSQRFVDVHALIAEIAAFLA